MSQQTTAQSQQHQNVHTLEDEENYIFTIRTMKHINEDIDNMVRKCQICTQYSSSQSAEPLQNHEIQPDLGKSLGLTYSTLKEKTITC